MASNNNDLLLKFMSRSGRRRDTQPANYKPAKRGTVPKFRPVKRSSRKVAKY